MTISSKLYKDSSFTIKIRRMSRKKAHIFYEEILVDIKIRLVTRIFIGKTQKKLTNNKSFSRMVLFFQSMIKIFCQILYYGKLDRKYLKLFGSHEKYFMMNLFTKTYLFLFINNVKFVNNQFIPSNDFVKLKFPLTIN